MSLQEFMESGGCEGCMFHGTIDVNGAKGCTFAWYDDDSDEWEYGKNCDELR